MPEISVAKINPKAPLDKVCLLGCGITTGIGAVLNTARCRPAPPCGVRPRPASACRWCRRGDGQGQPHHRSRYQSGQVHHGQGPGRDDCVNPKDYDVPVQQGDRGISPTAASITPSSASATSRDALGAGVLHKGWGESIINRRRRSGEEIRTRPFQLVTGRVWRARPSAASRDARTAGLRRSLSAWRIRSTR